MEGAAPLRSCVEFMVGSYESTSGYRGMTRINVDKLFREVPDGIPAAFRYERYDAWHGAPGLGREWCDVSVLVLLHR